MATLPSITGFYKALAEKLDLVCESRYPPSVSPQDDGFMYCCGCGRYVPTQDEVAHFAAAIYSSPSFLSSAMSRFSHTPGPWSIGDTRTAHMGWKEIEIKSARGGLVTIVEYKSDWATTDIDQMKADAHLIATAPELLVELKGARQAIEDMYEVDSATAGQHFGRTMVERMNTLIAKAESFSSSLAA